MKLGVITDCFRLPLEESLKMAAELGFNGVQIYATIGEFCPDMPMERRKEIKTLLKSLNLEVSALCGDMGGHGFQIEKDNAERVEKTKRIIDLACDFDTKVVTTHIGVIPADKSHPRYAVMLDALSKCGAYAKEKGVTLAIETGPETADVLYDFVSAIDGGVGVNLDPANFVMVAGQDSVEAVNLLKNHIVHTHAKDGVMLKKTDPEMVYGCFAGEKYDGLDIGECFRETPLGEGSVDFPKYIEALRAVGYDGYLTVERETGEDPRADIIIARDMLKQVI